MSSGKQDRERVYPSCPSHMVRGLAEWSDECENDVYHMLRCLHPPGLNTIEHISWIDILDRPVDHCH